MLGQIRDKATGWIAGIIVGALIISFAFWGVSFYFGGNGQANVAIVNDAEIDLQTYQRSFTNLKRQMQSIFGDELSLEEEELIRQQTIQRLVDTEIVNQIVRDNNLQVSDAQVAATITSLELFQDEQGFDRNKYEQGIANLGMAPAYFERQLRMDLLSEQLQSGLAETSFVTKDELNDVLRIKNQMRDITYTIISVDDYLDTIEIADSDIQSFYSDNKEKYAAPEQVQIAYIDLDAKKLADTIEFTEQDLRDYYQNNKDQYDVAEQRSVTKLFVKTGEGAPEEDIANARTQIEKALEQVNSGIDFEKIIEEAGQDDASLLEFSEHAFMTRGIMGDEIDEFLFANDEEAISGIIESKAGFNIVKVGEIRGGPKNVFENVAEQVEYDYRLNQAELNYFELSDKISTLAYEHPDTLDVAAEESGLEVVETEYFARENDNDDITSDSKVIAASFQQELIDSGNNSDAIELGENHMAIIRVIDYKPSEIQPLEAVRTDIVADMKQERAIQQASEDGDSIIEQLQSGLSIEEVQLGSDISWNTAENAKRDATDVTRSVLRTAFQIDKPEDGPGLTGYQLGSGDYAVVMVTAVADGIVEEVAESKSKTTANDILRVRSSNEWREFLDTAKSKASVRIFEENI